MPQEVVYRGNAQPPSLKPAMLLMTSAALGLQSSNNSNTLRTTLHVAIHQCTYCTVRDSSVGQGVMEARNEREREKLAVATEELRRARLTK